MRNYNVIFFFIALIIIASACKNKTNKTEAEEIDEVVLEEAQDMIQSIPAPSALIVLNMLNEAGAGYIFDITNKTEYAENYLTTRQKALALGVYSADISYVSLYQQKEEASAYAKVFQQLLEELQISVFDASYMERYQNNLEFKDSLINLVNDAINKANKQLNSNDRVDIALFVLTGSWIETVFLIEKTIEFSTNKAPLVQIVLKNKQMLEKIISLLELKKDDEDFADLYDTLIEIQGYFNEVYKDPTNEQKTDDLKSIIKETRANII